MDSTLFTTKKSELTDKISASSQELLDIQSISLSFAYPIKPHSLSILSICTSVLFIHLC